MRQPKRNRKGGSNSRRAFVEDRRDPTDRRSWRRVPVWVGDVAAPHSDPTRLMVVTGVLPRGRVEVVGVERARRAVGAINGLDCVQQALADGRIIARAVPRDRLSPVTDGLLTAVQQQTADGNEVTA